MRKNFITLLIFTACACDTYATVKIPSGFEILAQGMEERVEVILAGNQVGLFDATVSLDTVQFADPKKVLAALKLPITPDDPAYRQILKLLSAPLARHGELACGYAQERTGCGYLKTDSVDAIYDNSEARVTLFLRQAWMPENARQSLYLAADTSNVENAFIHQQALNVVAQDDYSSLYLHGDGALGMTENSYLALDWSLTSTQTDDNSDNSTDINNLYYRYDLARRYYLQLGRMDNRTLF
ncbi:MAG: TcfC E-set like domain-containing protein, partial [Kluyvera sp.]